MPSSRQETRLPLPEPTLINPRSRSSICSPPPAGGGVVGGGVVGPSVGGAPVQVAPLSAKLAGPGLLLVHEPLKPNAAVPLVPMVAL